MKCYPEDEDDRKYLADLKVEPWMADCLKLNPEYVHWGVGDDYMKGVPKNKDEGGWDSGVRLETWKEFEWELDDLNELVNFAFELHRKSKHCETCAATGYHPDAQWVQKAWYKHTSPFRTPSWEEQEMTRRFRQMIGVSSRPEDLHPPGSLPTEETLKKYKPEFRAFCEEMRNGDGFWSDKLIQAEVDALVAEGRLMDYTHDFKSGKGWEEKPGGAKKHTPTAAEVNAAQNSQKPGLHGHDSLNESVCVRARCERFGIPVTCMVCDGHGSVYTAPAGTLGINLWFIHPRKGCSRGVEILSIEKSELKAVFKFIRDGAKRNEQRFQRVIEKL